MRTVTSKMVSQLLSRSRNKTHVNYQLHVLPIPSDHHDGVIHSARIICKSYFRILIALVRFVSKDNILWMTSLTHHRSKFIMRTNIKVFKLSPVLYREGYIRTQQPSCYEKNYQCCCMWCAYWPVLYSRYVVYRVIIQLYDTLYLTISYC